MTRKRLKELHILNREIWLLRKRLNEFKPFTEGLEHVEFIDDKTLIETMRKKIEEKIKDLIRQQLELDGQLTNS
ncbi:MAG: hypothetical protein FWH05_09465 [Oscillospiraceae bacterium]|nr:hypothetical protein [Oscillospiraceae bacterium]